MKSYLYSNGLPFNGKLNKSLDGVMNRIAGGKAACIVIDGASGEGKTTLAVEVVNYVQGYYSKGGGWIDFKTQYAMGGKDFQIKLRLSKEHKKIVVVYDEAGDFSNRNFASGFNKILQRVFETYRTYKILVLAILPLVGDLDNGLFKLGVVRLLLNCHNRPIKIIGYKEDGSPIIYSPYCKVRVYSLFRTFYLKDKMKKLTVSRMAYKYVKPNFRCYFKNLPPDREKELDILSTKGKDKSMMQSEIKQKGLLTYDQLENKLNKCKTWVRAKVKELNIKPALQIGQKKFFSQNALDKLENQIL